MVVLKHLQRWSLVEASCKFYYRFLVSSKSSAVKCKLIMLLSIILLAKLSCFVCFIQKANENSSTSLCKYVSSLIAYQNAEDPTRNHDVTLFWLQKTTDSSIFEEILREVLKSNPNNPVYAHTLLDPVPPFKIHATSIFIITTDLATRDDIVSLKTF